MIDARSVLRSIKSYREIEEIVDRRQTHVMVLLEDCWIFMIAGVKFRNEFN